MLSPAIQKAITEQIRREFEASHVYLGMAAHFETKSLAGFGAWARAQANEERDHGLKLFDFLLDRGVQVELHDIKAAPTVYDSPLAAMESALEREKSTTAAIQKLYEIAGAERDYATQAQLQWFLTEQVEEENSTSQIVDRLRLAGNEGAANILLDTEVGRRAASPE